MKSEIITMETEIIASDDGMHTYEVRRTWNSRGQKAIVIALYPTIASDNVNKLDSSTMYLLNHAKDLGWGEMRVLNLYSTIFERKPAVSRLLYDEENLLYIKSVLEEVNIKEYEIVIAYGNSLSGHHTTQLVMKEILTMIKDKELVEQVKHIVTPTLDSDKTIGAHSLFLGLRYSKEKWMTEPYPLDDVLSELSKPSQKAGADSEEAKNKEKEENCGEKGKEQEDVLQNQKQTRRKSNVKTSDKE